MRKPAEWMTWGDERILEYLRDVGAGSPGKISEHEHVDYTSQYVGRRCRKLRDSGMVRELGNGVYQITEEGEAYLTGELDASELPNPD